MTEPIEFCFHNFISHLTVSQLQPRAITCLCCRLAQPMIGFLFVAKYLLGLALNQLNILHFQTLIVGGRWHTVSANF